MKNRTKLFLISFTAIIGIGITSTGLGNTEAASWKANSVSTIQKALKSDNSTYTIRWGDTLSTISEALNKNGIETSVSRLSEINRISNIDLIFAGNKMVFKGTGTSATVTVKDNQGKDRTFNLSSKKSIAKKPSNPGIKDDTKEWWKYTGNSSAILTNFINTVNFPNYGITVGAPSDPENWEVTEQRIGDFTFLFLLDDDEAWTTQMTDQKFAKFFTKSVFQGGLIIGISPEDDWEEGSIFGIDLNQGKYKYVEITPTDDFEVEMTGRYDGEEYEGYINPSYTVKWYSPIEAETK